ncbi:MAG: hypothetical protein A2X88_08625 [Deltaproteobacteria bacterium GWC2_65_14]|nr:MAG: hypothetical protein A2X88_08625 [Deltaproteobacteria bacterium GWC2_65_14]
MLGLVIAGMIGVGLLAPHLIPSTLGDIGGEVGKAFYKAYFHLGDLPITPVFLLKAFAQVAGYSIFVFGLMIGLQLTGVNLSSPVIIVHRLANTLAFERRCLRASFVALLHHTQRYASVARLAGRGASTLSVRQAIYETVH